MSQINITENNNQVDVTTLNNQVVVTNPDNPATINLVQPVTSVVEVITAGPQGPQGLPGSGSAIDTGSFATTGSNNFSGSQIIRGDLTLSGSDNINSTLRFLSGAVITTSGPNIDMTAGPGGWSELGSNSGQNYVWVDDNGLYLVTSWDSNTQTSAWRILTGSRQLVAVGDLDMNGHVITGSLIGTASYSTQALSSSFALTASYALNAGTTFNTGSFVTTASFNAFTSSYNTGSFTGSFVGNLTGTSSFATTASYITSVKSLSGSVASFAGTPYSSSVTFGTAYTSNYGVSVIGEDLRAWSISGKTSTGFTINSNSSVALTGPVYWITTPFNS